jgi:anti-anti-sigma regulatory factor
LIPLTHVELLMWTNHWKTTKTERNPHQFARFLCGFPPIHWTMDRSDFAILARCFQDPVNAGSQFHCLVISGHSDSLSNGPRMSDSSDSFSNADRSPEQHALTEDGVLKLYSAGPVTVLGFGGHDVPSEFNVAHYRAAINEILLAHQSRIVAFDLTGVQLLPSGMLGLLVSISRMGPAPPRVQVCNAAPDIREVLTLTRINTLIEVCE